MTRTRNWCFTLNNWTEDEYVQLCILDKQIRYLIVGKEVGEQGTPHLQGFVIFHNDKTFEQVKKYFGDRYHISPCAGSPKQNIAYCSKDGNYIELGDPPSQGKRTDISEVKQMVKDGKSMSQIVEVATSYQSIRMAEVCMKYKPLKERVKPTVKWYWGPTGTGKTREAFKELGYDDTWVSHDSLKWFDGYDGQKNVIIDDFRGSDCKFSNLLRYLDRYPIKVPVKGGYVNWVPEVIIVTSTHHPSFSYVSENIQESISQLIRRIDVIDEFE